MVEAVNRRFRCEVASALYSDQFNRIATSLTPGSIVVLHRVPWNDTIHDLVRVARRQACMVLSDFDDLIFDSTMALEVLKGTGQEVTKATEDAMTRRLNEFELTLRNSDAVILSTSYLADYCQRRFSVPTSVVENFLSVEQCEISLRKAASRVLDGRGRSVGFFSGTPTHSRDFRLVHNALRAFLRKNRENTLTIVGCCDWDETEFRSQTIRLPLVHYTELPAAIASVDACIVPLAESVFTHGKSAQKLFEAAAVGTQSLASPTHTYKQIQLRSGITRLVGDEDWTSALEELSETSDSQIEQFAARLPRLAMQFFSSDQGASSILEAISKVHPQFLSRIQDRLDVEDA